MKKVAICFILVFIISLSGCFTYHYLEAEPGSKWVSEDSIMFFEVLNEGLVQGKLAVKEEIIEIDCFFGSGKTDFAIYKQDDRSADSCLLKGDYHYDKKKQTITFTIAEDYIGMDTKEIVLHRENNL